MQSLLSVASKHDRAVLAAMIPPTDFTVHKWIEPYFTTGDAMFAIAPRRYAVSCATTVWSEWYLQIAFNPHDVWRAFEDLQAAYHGDAKGWGPYYDALYAFNRGLSVKSWMSAEDAARVLFFKLTSRSHVYPTEWTPFREPPGGKSRQHVLRKDAFMEVAAYLEQTRRNGTQVITAGHPIGVVDKAQTGDVVFADLRGKNVSKEAVDDLLRKAPSLTSRFVYMILILPEALPLCRTGVHVQDGLRVYDNVVEVDRACEKATKERRKAVAASLATLKDFGLKNPFPPDALEQLYNVREVSDEQLYVLVRAKINSIFQ